MFLGILVLNLHPERNLDDTTWCGRKELAIGHQNRTCNCLKLDEAKFENESGESRRRKVRK